MKSLSLLLFYYWLSSSSSSPPEVYPLFTMPPAVLGNCGPSLRATCSRAFNQSRFQYIITACWIFWYSKEKQDIGKAKLTDQFLTQDWWLKDNSHPSNKDDKEEHICDNTTAPWLTSNAWFTAAKEKIVLFCGKGTHDTGTYLIWYDFPPTSKAMVTPAKYSCSLLHPAAGQSSRSRCIAFKMVIQ